MTKENQVAKVTEEKTNLVDAPDYISKTKRGTENITNNDILIPRIEIIQQGSPQRKKNDVNP